jgi:hypothetical protein
LAERTGIARSVVQRALKRLVVSGLVDERLRRVRVVQLEEFVVHGLRYVFPAVVAGESRGVATAWAAEPLLGRVSQPAGGLPLVWPDALGAVRGLALVPLHPAVVVAARRDQALGELLVLADAIRVGDARLHGVAAELLGARVAGVEAV